MGAGGRPPNGQQIKQMLEAFLDAFNRDELKEVVLLEMNERLDTIVADDNLRTTIFELIMWAKRQGRVGELINATAGAKPGKALMIALARDAQNWGLETPIAAPAAQPAGGPAVAQPAQPAAPAPQADGPQLTATLALKMAYVPSAIVNLLQRERYPLVQVELVNAANRARQLSVETEVHGYSDPWSNTVSLGVGSSATATAKVLQRPVFVPEKLPAINTLRQVQIRVKVIELSTNVVQLVESKEVWMLPINSAPVRVKDETTGALLNMLPYLGAFVTESEPSIKAYLKTVALLHPEKKLEGYYAAGKPGGVRKQVRALSAALQQSGKLTYAPALVKTIAGSDYQQVRLPRECLSVGLANCLEGVLLYCSLLEAMGLQSAIVWSREHAIVGWKESGAADAKWFYLDTTKVDQGTFEKAMEWGDLFVDENTGKPEDEFGILPIRDLRAQGITPLE